MKVHREPGWHELKVAIIAMAALAFFVILVLKVESGKGLFQGAHIVKAKLSDLRGLRKGAPVQFSGVEVGSVQNVTFLPDGQVDIDLSVSPEIKPFVKVSSFLSIESMGILGDKFVKIHPGKPDDALLPSDSKLKSLAASGATDVMYEASSAVASAKEAALTLNRVMQKIDEAEGTLGKMISDPSLFDDFKGAVGALSKALDGKGTIAKLSKDPRLYNNLDSAAKKLSQALTKMNKGDSTMGKLLTEDTLYKNMNTMVSEIGALAKDIRENPKKYVRVSVF